MIGDRWVEGAGCQLCMSERLPRPIVVLCHFEFGKRELFALYSFLIGGGRRTRPPTRLGHVSAMVSAYSFALPNLIWSAGVIVHCLFISGRRFYVMEPCLFIGPALHSPFRAQVAFGSKGVLIPPSFIILRPFC